MTPDEFAAYLRGCQERVIPSLEEAVFDVTLSAVNRSRELIGQENPEWVALADLTVDYKKRHGYVNRISPTDPLLRTGDMRASIGGEVEGLVGIVGSTDRKAVVHELGGHVGHSTIPARPFLSLALAQTIPEIEGFMEDAAIRIFVP